MIFKVKDVTYHNGSSFICILEHDSTSTPESEPGVGASWQTYWNYMAKAGSSGTSGIDGTNGISGSSGSSGTSGSSGSSGITSLNVLNNINISGNVSAKYETYNNLTLNITRTLPSAAEHIGVFLIFKKMDTSIYTINIVPLTGENIDGDITGYLLELEDEFVQLMAINSTTWSVIAE